MMQILRDIYADAELSKCLGFKGGTALMFFCELPRFSVDLDFNLLQVEKEEEVYHRLQSILLKYGKLEDAAIKHYGIVCVLNYEAGERNLKVEVSNRQYQTPNAYEIRNLLGINIRVLSESDMFAHKLCALLDRAETTNRDIFDVWFFLNRHTPIHAQMVEERMGMSLSDYIEQCIIHLEGISDHTIHAGLGELIDNKLRQFVHTQLRTETISLLRIFQAYPLCQG